MALAASLTLASCETGTPPAPAPGPPARASAAEIHAATRTVSRCMYDAAVERDDRKSAVRAVAKRVVGPCHAQFEAMLLVEEKGMGLAEAAAFDRAMHKQELHIATMEVMAARDHLASGHSKRRARRHHRRDGDGTASAPAAKPKSD